MKRHDHALSMIMTTHKEFFLSSSPACSVERYLVMMTHMTKAAAPRASEFLSIKDAAEHYRKAQITIRRFVRSVLQKEKGKERLLIRPLPKEATKLKRGHIPFSYTIAEGLLEKHFGFAGGERAKEGSVDEVRALLEKMNMSLTDQLKVKDGQIRTLAQAIDDLSERQRETNILMKGLQEGLLLAGPEPQIIHAPSARAKAMKKRWWKLWR